MPPFVAKAVNSAEPELPPKVLELLAGEQSTGQCTHCPE